MTTFVIVMTSLNILVWVLLFLSRKKAQKNMIETVMKISLGNIKQEVEKIPEFDSETIPNFSNLEDSIDIQEKSIAEQVISSIEESEESEDETSRCPAGKN